MFAPSPLSFAELKEIEAKDDERAYKRSLKTMEHFAALQREQSEEEWRKELHRRAKTS